MTVLDFYYFLDFQALHCMDPKLLPEFWMWGRTIFSSFVSCGPGESHTVLSFWRGLVFREQQLSGPIVVATAAPTAGGNVTPISSDIRIIRKEPLVLPKPRLQLWGCAHAPVTFHLLARDFLQPRDTRSREKEEFPS